MWDSSIWKRRRWWIAFLDNKATCFLVFSWVWWHDPNNRPPYKIVFGTTKRRDHIPFYKHIFFPHTNLSAPSQYLSALVEMVNFQKIVRHGVTILKGLQEFFHNRYRHFRTGHKNRKVVPGGLIQVTQRINKVTCKKKQLNHIYASRPSSLLVCNMCFLDVKWC